MFLIVFLWWFLILLYLPGCCCGFLNSLENSKKNFSLTTDNLCGVPFAFSVLFIWLFLNDCLFPCGSVSVSLAIVRFGKVRSMGLWGSLKFHLDLKPHLATQGRCSEAGGHSLLPWGLLHSPETGIQLQSPIWPCGSLPWALWQGQNQVLWRVSTTFTSPMETSATILCLLLSTDLLHP